MVIESAYARDVQVIGQMFALSDGWYRNGFAPPATADPQYHMALWLSGMREALQKLRPFNKVTEPDNPRDCTPEVAFHNIEIVRFTKINALPVQEARRQMEKIVARNRGVPREQIPPQDRAVFDRLVRDVVTPAHHEAEFVSDLENLKGLWRVARLKYESNKKDATDSGGDIDSLGHTLGTLTGPNGMYLSILNKIGEAFPSQLVKEWNQAQPNATKQ